jgi:peptidoglycan/LPS O-acetylase OafA/YrhL
VLDGRAVQLDTLRCVAVLGVLMSHLWQPRPLPWIFGSVDWGHLGVQLFFVLSGFLITDILLDGRDAVAAGETSARRYAKTFYIRRFIRIFPVYYATLIALVVLDFERTRELAPSLFTYTTNYYIAFTDSWIGNIGHFWTLAVEEQFYLLWPWLVLLVPGRWLLRAIVVTIALGLLTRLAIVGVVDIRANDIAAGTLGPASFDSLGAGALLAVVVRSRPEDVRRLLSSRILPLGLFGIGASLVVDHYVWTTTGWFVAGDLFVAAVFCWLVGTASFGFAGVVGRVLRLRPLVYVGSISYGVYLFHPFSRPFLLEIARRLDVATSLEPGFGTFALCSAVTIVVAAASWELFERPFNGLKRHVPYRSPRRASGEGEILVQRAAVRETSS